MNDKISRLLFTEEPYFDEGFVGYILRLMELNEVPDIRWIFKLLRPGRQFNYDFDYSLDFKVKISNLSELTGINEENLSSLLYSAKETRCPNYFNSDIFKDPINYKLICRQRPKICPRCLEEKNYCRKIWEHALVTACLIHKCLLLDHCPKCLCLLSWKRPGISVCSCKFDLRKSEVFHLKPVELKLSCYLHQHFYQYINSYREQSEFDFLFPLKTLSYPALIKLILFVAVHFSNKFDPEGSWFFKYLSQEYLHACLTAAVNVFENWAENYHIFVRDWHKWESKGFSNRKNISLWDDEGFSETYDYQTFNYVLYEYFEGKQFAFLRRRFDDFIEKFLAGEFPDEPLLFDKYSRL